MTTAPVDSSQDDPARTAGPVRVAFLSNLGGSGGMGVYARCLATALARCAQVTVGDEGRGRPQPAVRDGSTLVIRHGWAHNGGRTYRTADVSSGVCADRRRNVFITAFDPTFLWPHKIQEIVEHFGTVWVDSRFAAARAVTAGLGCLAIHVLPPPLSVRPVRRPSGWDGYRFMHVATGDLAVKGTDIVLDAFARLTAGPGCRATLTLKVSGRDLDRMRLDELLGRLPPTTRRAIRCIDGSVGPVQMAALYAETDCYLHVSRTDSLGLPMLEAAACGARLVTHGWGAAEELSVGTDHLIADGAQVTMPAAAYRDNFESAWYETSPEALAARMAEAVADGPRDLTVQADQLRQRYGAVAYHTGVKRVLMDTVYGRAAEPSLPRQPSR
jgi:hypothetical protein